MSDTIPESSLLKQCGVCKQWKPATFEYFHKDKRHSQEMKPQCLECPTDRHRKRNQPLDADGNKQCPRCMRWKPATTEYFYTLNSTSTKFKATCKECSRKAGQQREYQKPKKYRHAQQGATTKICSKCKLEKPLYCFYSEPGCGILERSSRCSLCQNPPKPENYKQKELPLFKTCRKCHQEKNIEEFYISRAKKSDGFAALCKPCSLLENKLCRLKYLDERREKDHLREAARIYPKRRDRSTRRSPFMMRNAERQMREKQSL